MLLFISFWLNTDYFPFQFPVILLFGLLGNPPARLCGWRTKFPPSPSSFPQNRKIERRYVHELPWGQSLFLDNSEHRRANLRLTLVFRTVSQTNACITLVKSTLILWQQRWFCLDILHLMWEAKFNFNITIKTSAIKPEKSLAVVWQ